MKKTPGRQRIDPADDTVPVMARMSSRQYDAMRERAKAARVSIAEQFRRDVRAASAQAQRRPR